MGTTAVAVFLFLSITLGGAGGLDWTAEFNGYEYDVTYSTPEAELSWYDARAECMSEGGDLASIESDAEDDFIGTISTPYTNRLWIGLNKLGGEWRWIDGSTATFRQWDEDQPKIDDLCVLRTSRKESSWISENCSDTRGRLCKRKKGSTKPRTTTTAPLIGGYCPEGYIGAGPSSDRCYKFYPMTGTKAKTWEKANDACKKENYPGAMLASITTPEENALIILQLETYGSTVDFYIGLYRITDYYEWGWRDNVPLSLTYWSKYHDDYGSGCGYTNYGNDPLGSWSIEYMGRTPRGYICQIYKDPSNVIPTPAPTPAHSCETGYVSYLKGCYILMYSKVDWQSADSDCRNRGAQLVDIHGPAENAFVLLTMLESQDETIWTGFRKREETSEYEWTSGWYVQYTNWASDQPETPPGGGCVAMDADGEWKDENCASARPYICKKTTADPNTPPPEVEGRCPGQSWFDSGEHCYKTCAACSKSFLEATTECVKLHPQAKLASIHSFVENDMLYKIAQEQRVLAAPWLGIFRSAQTGQFMWRDETEIEYTNFAPGEPSEKDGYDCVYMSPSPYGSLWITTPCTNKRGYFCKMAKLPIPTTPAVVVGSCPDERWRKYGADCFLFRPDESFTWKNAADQCVIEGGPSAYLTSIYTMEESVFIHDTMVLNSHHPVRRNYWIGLSKPGPWPAQYEWAVGHRNLTYDNWDWSEPDDTKGTDNCVQVHYETARWHDESCDDTLGFVCRAPVATTTDDTPQNSGSGGLGGGAIAGIVIGLLLACVIVPGVIYLAVRRRQGKPMGAFERFGRSSSRV